MGLFSWPFGRAKHPVTEKPFMAIPITFWETEGQMGRAWAMRFIFTTLPDRLQDVAFIHAAAIDLLHTLKDAKTAAARRVRRHIDSSAWYADSTCLEAPVEVVGSSGLWIRVSKLPRQDIPASVGSGDDWTGPLLVRFAARPRDLRVVERPAETTVGRARQRIERLRRRGASPVLAALVQANYGLFDPNGADNLPCMVVFSHDDSVTVDELDAIAERFGVVKGQPQSDPDLAAISEMVTNETAVMYRRRRVPMRFTDGRLVYAADLWITREFLPDGYVSARELWCLAEPTDRGGLELFPQDEHPGD